MVGTVVIIEKDIIIIKWMNWHTFSYRVDSLHKITQQQQPYAAKNKPDPNWTGN